MSHYLIVGTPPTTAAVTTPDVNAVTHCVSPEAACNRAGMHPSDYDEFKVYPVAPDPDGCMMVYEADDLDLGDRPGDHKCPYNLEVDDYDWVDDGVLIVEETCKKCGATFKETMERTDFEKVDEA